VDADLVRALDRCDCRRCRALAQQLDALIPTASHVAAYVAMGVALVLTAVLAARSLGWEWQRLLGMALLVGTVWFLCLMGAMAWAGARFLSPDPLAWGPTSVWRGWTVVIVGMWVALLAIQLLTSGPVWVIVIVLVVSSVQGVLIRRRAQRQRAECWRDGAG
jgi:hypothetical protein